MLCTPQKFTVSEIIEAKEAASLQVNPEYQRGAAWKLSQQPGLVDSVFRGYPIPSLYLHRRIRPGLGGPSEVYDIVDGQQRIRALGAFKNNDFPVLKTADPKLRLPNSLRKRPAPWQGLRFQDLTEELQKQFLTYPLPVVIVTEEESQDEIRDIYIRLQAGTALSRQQIRDAWPGNLGPFIELLAGKKAGLQNKMPSVRLFGLVDRRGSDAEDEHDDYEPDRQLCAQLLCLYLAWERNPNTEQGVGAAALDAIYHDQTDFDTKGEAAESFKILLEHGSNVLEKALEMRKATGTTTKKFKKLDVFALFLLFLQWKHLKHISISSRTYEALAARLIDFKKASSGGRSTSGRAILDHYYEWRSGLNAVPGIENDSARSFSLEQREAMIARQDNRCAICRRELDKTAEADHFPLPHYLGGRTDLENGRMVHAKCHPRGPGHKLDEGLSYSEIQAELSKLGGTKTDKQRKAVLQDQLQRILMEVKGTFERTRANAPSETSADGVVDRSASEQLGSES